MHVSGKGKGIKELDLNKVFTTPSAKESLSMVRSLDLSHNKLTRVDSLRPLMGLVTLDLSHNAISELANLPPTLRRLSLQHNNLSSLAAVGILPCLEQLDISNNHITTLRRLSPQIPLQVLLADNNGITQLVAGGGDDATTDGTSNNIAQLKSLRMVSFNGNMIASLSDIAASLGPLPLLEAASFAGCPVTQLNGYRQGVLRRLVNLATLDGTAVAREEENGPTSSSFVEEAEEEEYAATNGHRRSSSAKRASANVSFADEVGTTAGNATNRNTRSALAMAMEQLPREAAAGRRQTTAASSTYPSTTNHQQQASSSSSAAYTATLQQQCHSQHEVIAQLRKGLKDTLERYKMERAEGDALRGKLKAMAAQLADAQRVISNQLDTIAQLRAERDAAVEQLSRTHQKCVKQGNELRYAQSIAKSQQTLYEEEKERLRVRASLGEQLGGVMSTHQMLMMNGNRDNNTTTTTADQSIYASSTAAPQHTSFLSNANNNRSSFGLNNTTAMRGVGGGANSSTLGAQRRASSMTGALGTNSNTAKRGNGGPLITPSSYAGSLRRGGSVGGGSSSRGTPLSTDRLRGVRIGGVRGGSVGGATASAASPLSPPTPTGSDTTDAYSPDLRDPSNPQTNSTDDDQHVMSIVRNESTLMTNTSAAAAGGVVGSRRRGRGVGGGEGGDEVSASNISAGSPTDDDDDSYGESAAAGRRGGARQRRAVDPNSTSASLASQLKSWLMSEIHNGSLTASSTGGAQ